MAHLEIEIRLDLGELENRRDRALPTASAPLRGAASPGYGWLQPDGYQVVTEGSSTATDDAPPVHVGSGGALCDAADAVTNADDTSTVSNASLTKTPCLPLAVWNGGSLPTSLLVE